MRILLVNNCGELCDLFNSCLEFSSHKIFQCTNNALDRLLQMESFDLVFVSVEDLSVAELLTFKNIRSSPKHEDAFVVLACSTFREDYIQQAFDLGVDEYLISPTTGDDLGLLLCLVERIRNASNDSNAVPKKLAA